MQYEQLHMYACPSHCNLLTGTSMATPHIAGLVLRCMRGRCSGQTGLKVSGWLPAWLPAPLPLCGLAYVHMLPPPSCTACITAIAQSYL